MPGRSLFALVSAGILALAVIAIVSIGAGDATPAERSGTGFAGSIRPAGIPPAELTGLVNQDGNGVNLAALRGTPVVVTFLYTSCEDTCPTTAQQIRAALDDIGQDVPVLAISVDPANDTPERARRFLARQRLVGRMQFLVGDRAALARQWTSYGIAPQTADGEHTGVVVILDRNGRQRIGFPADRLTASGLAQDLQTLAREPAADRPADPASS